MHDNVNAPFSSHENIPFSPAMSHGYTAPSYGHMIPDCGYITPDYGYGVPHHRGNGFAIIIVLFILLIIIGACGFGFHHDDC
ncbi:YjcZ family sporulation protein [Priestia megaterium]|jgi:uncharacterized protein (TIGR01732 family)|uniref:Sporulation protein YjcZ n=2 Tax=Bacillaceae TaxID=186817 RepID=A0A3D8X0Z5_PRIMG|nr:MULTISPECIES: YjcZ family sporulation protein [Priestia]MDH3171176.1 YjcZ family sporulation protein [Priestia megaterium]MDR7242574.1 uncharacterized protein (TIGR01732 family) [Priestia megaterium]QTL47916.1 YjcZ family sporulation protein [Priestia aryabhattai]RDZ13402.1 sporulation protein YjcZ [Priestia megaterium]USL40841.1 YjcZ family sporulation protein [Priestia megaterium]